MLTVNEVSKMLKVTVTTVYRWIYADKLKAHKIQGVVRIQEKDLKSFIGGKV